MNVSRRDTLIIGFGNPLRGDDGVGDVVCARLQQLDLRDVVVMSVQQLTPELTVPLSQARRALFIDATMEQQLDPVSVRQLDSDEAGSLATHAFQPESLLALAQLLYGRSSPAWLLTIRGCDFCHGDTLSEAAQQHISQAMPMLVDWISTPADRSPASQPTT